MEVSDADRLRARGVLITLQGKPYRVILDFEAVELLEEEFGGLDLFVAKLREEQYKNTRYRTVRKAMVAGLVHSKPAEQDLTDFDREIRALLAPRDMIDYLDALTLAITEAFPAVEAGEAPKVNGSRAGSRGRSSITTQRSDMAEATASSGA